MTPAVPDDASSSAECLPDLEVIRSDVDPSIVTDPRLREAIASTGRPWHVRERKAGIELMLIPSGTYLRGDPNEDAAEGESPAHPVTISRSFYLGRHPVTNAQFRRFRPKWHSTTHGEVGLDVGLDLGVNGDDQPVVETSWDDTRPFLIWLDTLADGRRLGRGRRFRLPTEAEWEYAARAGTSSRFVFGDEPGCLEGRANVFGPLVRERLGHEHEAFPFDDAYPVTNPIGAFPPNGFGLEDMIGNVWEWCADVYDGSEYERCKAGVTDPRGPRDGSLRVLRGGSWFNGPADCAVWSRRTGVPDARDRLTFVGFRVALPVH